MCSSANALRAMRTFCECGIRNTHKKSSGSTNSDVTSGFYSQWKPNKNNGCFRREKKKWGIHFDLKANKFERKNSSNWKCMRRNLGRRAVCVCSAHSKADLILNKSSLIFHVWKTNSFFRSYCLLDKYLQINAQISLRKSRYKNCKGYSVEAKIDETEYTDLLTVEICSSRTSRNAVILMCLSSIVQASQLNSTTVKFSCSLQVANEKEHGRNMVICCLTWFQQHKKAAI